MKILFEEINFGNIGTSGNINSVCKVKTESLRGIARDFILLSGMIALTISVFSNPVSADEIVVNNSGQAIVLKSDGTWKILDTGDEKKVMIRITGVENSYYNVKSKDKFKNVLWKHGIGCSYSFDIRNPMKYPVKIIAFKFRVGSWENSYLYFNAVVNPGELKAVGKKSVIAHRFEQKEPSISKDELDKLFEKFGCTAQLKSGKAVLSPRNKIEFPPESGIDKKDAYRFVTTSEVSSVPLYNTFPK
jgi:hypothetical protein